MARRKAKRTVVATHGGLPSHPNAPQKAAGSRRGTSAFVQGATGTRGKIPLKRGTKKRITW